MRTTGANVLLVVALAFATAGGLGSQVAASAPHAVRVTAPASNCYAGPNRPGKPGHVNVTIRQRALRTYVLLIRSHCTGLGVVVELDGLFLASGKSTPPRTGVLHVLPKSFGPYRFDGKKLHFVLHVPPSAHVLTIDTGSQGTDVPSVAPTSIDLPRLSPLPFTGARLLTWLILGLVLCAIGTFSATLHRVAARPKTRARHSPARDRAGHLL